MNLIKTTALALVLTLNLANAMTNESTEGEATSSSSRLRTTDTIRTEIESIVGVTGAAKRKGEALDAFLKTLGEDFIYNSHISAVTDLKTQIAAKDIDAILSAFNIRSAHDVEESDEEEDSHAGSEYEQDSPEEEVDELLAGLPEEAQKFIRGLGITINDEMDEDDLITSIVHSVQGKITEGARAKDAAILLGQKLATLEPELDATKKAHESSTAQLLAAQAELESRAAKITELDAARTKLLADTQKAVLEAVTPLQSQLASAKETLLEMDGEQTRTNAELEAVKEEKKAAELALDAARTNLHSAGTLLNDIESVLRLDDDSVDAAQRLAKIAALFTPPEEEEEATADTAPKAAPTPKKGAPVEEEEATADTAPKAAPTPKKEASAEDEFVNDDSPRGFEDAEPTPAEEKSRKKETKKSSRKKAEAAAKEKADK